MASNRKVQRLLNEFMDLLSEYGSTETHAEQDNAIHSTTNVPLAEPMHVDQPTTEQTINAVPQNDKPTDTVQLEKGQTDIPTERNDQATPPEDQGKDPLPSTEPMDLGRAIKEPNS